MAGGISEMAVLRFKLELSSFSLVKIAVLNETKALFDIRSESSILKNLSYPYGPLVKGIGRGVS